MFMSFDRVNGWYQKYFAHKAYLQSTLMAVLMSLRPGLSRRTVGRAAAWYSHTGKPKPENYRNSKSDHPKFGACFRVILLHVAVFVLFPASAVTGIIPVQFFSHIDLPFCLGWYNNSKKRFYGKPCRQKTNYTAASTHAIPSGGWVSGTGTELIF